jgi:hypothetical protein
MNKLILTTMIIISCSTLTVSPVKANVLQNEKTINPAKDIIVIKIDELSFGTKGSKIRI